MLEIENYKKQNEIWPDSGRHILAQFNEDYVIVYQAYRPSIADFAVEHQYFGGDFSFSRMSWIKPNFLWMMYRCGWASKEGQEKVLAVYLRRTFFDSVLSEAYPSACPSHLQYDDWKKRIPETNVRLQWDPDHDPFGAPLNRKAIQLGLRNEFLLPFKGEAIIKVEDVTSFVIDQKQIFDSKGIDYLHTPMERIYPVKSEAHKTLGMSAPESGR